MLGGSAAPSTPGWVVRYGGNADEQVAIAHHLGERERAFILDIDDRSPLRPVGGRDDGSGRIGDPVEAELVGGQIEVGLPIAKLGSSPPGAPLARIRRRDPAAAARCRWLGVSAQIRCVTIQPLRRASAVSWCCLTICPANPVRIGAGAPFGVGDKIHLPVRLLERLRDVERAEPCPPGHHLLDRAADQDARASPRRRSRSACRERRACRRPTIWRRFARLRGATFPLSRRLSAPTSGCCA